MKKPLNVPDVARKHQPKFKIETLKEFPELYDWLKELGRFRKLEDYIYISDHKKDEIRLKIFTKEHSYMIVVQLPSEENPKGYLGTYSQCRKPRAGEEWTRGNDLPDGIYSKETWNNFKNCLIAHELVKVVRNSPNKDEE